MAGQGRVTHNVRVNTLDDFLSDDGGLDEVSVETVRKLVDTSSDLNTLADYCCFGV